MLTLEFSLFMEFYVPLYTLITKQIAIPIKLLQIWIDMKCVMIQISFIWNDIPKNMEFFFYIFHQKLSLLIQNDLTLSKPSFQYSSPYCTCITVPLSISSTFVWSLIWQVIDVAYIFLFSWIAEYTKTQNFGTDSITCKKNRKC